MKKKLIAICVCIAMLAIAIIGGTMAYFTDTDDAENVFTVGNIDIDLREFQGDGETPFEDIKNIMPGMTYDKVVDVKNEGSNPAYVRVTIVIPENMTPVWNEDTEWVPAEGNPENGSGTYVFTLNSPLAAGADTSAILTKVKLNEDVTELNVKDSYKVLVTAEAIQADSFATAEDAYKALDGANVAKKTSASNADELNKALESARLVQMTNNITAGKDIVMAEGAILDGNGYALTKTTDVDPSVNAGIATVGGTIQNITVSGETIDNKGFRAVYATNGISDDLVIEGATLTGTYALNISGDSEDYSLTVKNSKLYGWTSYAPLASAKFENVTFGTDTVSGYHNLKPQADTVLTNCNFDEDFVMDAGAKVTITLNNCTVAEQKVTAANFATVFKVEDEIEKFACTIVVDGETVAFAEKAK